MAGSMPEKLLGTAMAIAGCIIDPDTDPRERTLYLQGMSQTMQLASLALSIASHCEDREMSMSRQGTTIFDDAFSPADILQQMADAFNLSDEEFNKLLEVFRDFESRFKADQLTEDLPETLHVQDFFEKRDGTEAP